MRSGFLNSGQICLCGSRYGLSCTLISIPIGGCSPFVRVLVHADVYEEFLAKMKTEVESLKVFVELLVLLSEFESKK